MPAEGRVHPGTATTTHADPRVCSTTRVRRSDLAEFLKARRAAVSPEDAGLSPGGRRRTPGLRREEVALLAGVSVSWYTWLEQGRPINASADVLDAVARVLRLDAVERDHLFELAGHTLHGEQAQTGDVTLPAGTDALLDALEPAPAYFLGPRWEYLAWNRAQARLYPALDDLPDDERNLVWVVFARQDARALIVDWEDEARRVLSQFRADVTPRRDDPAVVALVERLRAASPEFDQWWPRHDVAGFSTRQRRFHHPQGGDLTFSYQVLIAAGAPDVRLVVQLPDDDPTRAWAGEA